MRCPESIQECIESSQVRGGGSFLTAGPLYQQRGAEIKRFFNNVEAFWNRQIKSLQKTETWVSFFNSHVSKKFGIGRKNTHPSAQEERSFFHEILLGTDKMPFIF